MAQPKKIILIGPMGVGKTTVGFQLARMLSMQFYDSDREIEKQAGADISWIFEIEKEESFRKREAQVIRELIEHENIVLSTGGGTVLRQENRDVLYKNGWIIYLKCSSEKLYERISNEKYRPLLQGKDRLTIIKKLLHERESYYESLADQMINTDKLTVKQTIQKILQTIEKNEEN